MGGVVQWLCPVAPRCCKVVLITTHKMAAMRNVNAADANRQFSALLREVARGGRITVLSRGKAVAAIVPVTDMQRERREAKEALMKRLRSQAPAGKRVWTREELYER